MMAEDTIDKVSERLTKLEVTVAQGFLDNKREFQGVHREIKVLHGKVDALDRKIDAKTDALSSEIKTVLDAVRKLGHEA